MRKRGSPAAPSGCRPDLSSGEPSWRDRVGERGGREEGGKEREVRGDGVSSPASCSSLLPGSPVGRALPLGTRSLSLH